MQYPYMVQEIDWLYICIYIYDMYENTSNSNIDWLTYSSVATVRSGFSGDKIKYRDTRTSILSVLLSLAAQK